MSIFSLAVMALAGISASSYFYYLYAPMPVKPSLGGVLRQRSLPAGDMARHFLSYIPAGLPANAPLLIVLHGLGIDSRKIRVFTGYQFEKLADQYGFAVVYPDGYGKSWNDCRIGSNTPAKKKNVDDVGFLQDLIEHMRRENGIDPARVYAMGYSNGGQMGLRLLAEQPAMLAGLAVAGTNLSVQQDSLCTFSKPTPRVMFASGTADSIIPYEGGKISLPGHRGLGSVMSSQDTARFFATLSGAGSLEHTPPVPCGDGTSLEVHTWTRDAQPAVVLYTVHGGGHVVPQTAYRFPRFFGKTTRGFDMPAACIDFFGL